MKSNAFYQVYDILNNSDDGLCKNRDLICPLEPKIM
jgi:hypothetical protein